VSIHKVARHASLEANPTLFQLSCVLNQHREFGEKRCRLGHINGCKGPIQNGMKFAIPLREDDLLIKCQIVD